LMPALGLAQGIGHGVEVRLTSPELIEVEPGKIVTGSFLISNTAGRRVELEETLELPHVVPQWRPLIPYSQPILLGIDETRVRLVTFLVPKECPPGRYDISYSVFERGRSGIEVRESFSVVVLRIIKLDATIEERPEIVTAGDEYKVRLRLANGGNSRTEMRVEARTSPEFPVVINPHSIALDAGSSTGVSVTVATDSELKRKTNHVLEIKALASGPEESVVSEKRTVFVEILPKIVEAVIPRQTIPSRLRLIVVGQEDSEGMQLEYSGSGDLDERGVRKIDFLLRGPNAKDASVYGMRDMYRLDYHDRDFSVELGDRLYSLSPLAERFTYGRGTGVRFRLGDVDLGSFLMKTPRIVPETKEVGVHAGYAFNSKYRIRGNFLNKQRADSPLEPAYETNIFTVQGRVNPNPALDLGVEFGLCNNEGFRTSGDLAHRITLDGQMTSRVWYMFENTYAGPGFLGYHRDVLHSSGTLAATLYRNLRLNFSYRLYHNNLDLHPSIPIALREKSIRGYVSYPSSWGMNISFDYEMLARRDEMAPTNFDYDEHILRLGVGQDFKMFSFQ
ncbi:MAG: hypothetical protein JSU72_20440, partial [Deltaproteobacteria bacterium]